MGGRIQRVYERAHVKGTCKRAHTRHDHTTQVKLRLQGLRVLWETPRADDEQHKAEVQPTDATDLFRVTQLTLLTHFDPADPTDSIDPSSPAKPTDPTDPTNSTDPADPTRYYNNLSVCCDKLAG
jgi:hypothetical protein